MKKTIYVMLGLMTVMGAPQGTTWAQEQQVVRPNVQAAEQSENEIARRRHGHANRRRWLNQQDQRQDRRPERPHRAPQTRGHR